MFQSTLEATLNSVEVAELKSTQDIDKYADFIVSTAVDRVIQTTKSEHPESQPILEETVVLTKERRRLNRQYYQVQDPLLKTHIISCRK